jgi:hypothetical protein
MPISKKDFEAGKDPASEESRVEAILAGSEALTGQELYYKIRGKPSAGRETLAEMAAMFWESRILDQMVKDGRIASKVIDRQIYYSSA